MASFLSSIADFFLPRFCLHCNIKLSPDVKYLCQECNDLIKPTTAEFLDKEFERKFSEQEIITRLYSSFLFDPDSPLQNLIHNLKYSGNYKIGIHLGKSASARLKQKLSELDIDFIVPVPLHTTKRAERGYNQSYYIAKGISEIVGKPVSKKFVKRNKFTVSQTGFNLTDRQTNMNDAFVAGNSKNISGKNFLLVDDVITTGATIEACGKVLKEKKAKNIFAFSVAIPMDATSFQEPILQELQDHS